MPSQRFIADANAVTECIRGWFSDSDVALHEPRFNQLDIDAVADVVRSGFVSSVGEQVAAFEQSLTDFTGAKYAVAVVNGTAALHVALMGCGVQLKDEVITQALTFVATCNAINYCGAEPVFVDVDKDTLGLSPAALRAWLVGNTRQVHGKCVNLQTGRRVSACLPMHTFGHPVFIDDIAKVCEEFNLALIEDAAEGLGSYYRGKHVGTYGRCATLSFNGNKIITTGGGGAIITDDEVLANELKHLTTTAKVNNGWASYHDCVGYNYRLPNLNAGLGVAQMAHLPHFLETKKQLAQYYQSFFSTHSWDFVVPIEQSQPNHWLNAVVLPDRSIRDAFIQYCAEQQIHVRPCWTPMHELPMFNQCQRDDLINTMELVGRLINLPSSAQAFKS